jgi:hypothetical protein
MSKDLEQKTGLKRKNIRIPLLLSLYTSVMNGQSISLFIEYPWEKRIKQRERVTGQRVIYFFQPINDNDLGMNQ